MKHLIIISLFIVYSSSVNLAIVKYSDEVIKEDFDYIIEKYDVIKYLIEQLSSSDLTYIIRYNSLDEQIDGRFETDGENIFISLKEQGLYSLQVKFAHEATHALQFETGKIAFFKNRRDEWRTLNLDLWDEAEAFSMMVLADSGFELDPKMKSKSSTILSHYKAKLGFNGYEEAANLLTGYYPQLSEVHQNNPTNGPKLIRTSRVIYRPFNSDIDYTSGSSSTRFSIIQ